MATAHVLPIADTVVHTRDDDCPCGPWQEPVEDDDGQVVGFVAVHASLDGREQHENTRWRRALRRLGYRPPRWAVVDERIGENA